MGDTLKGLAIFAVAAAVPFIVSATDLFGNEHAGVMKAVAAELRDPASAQFRDIQQGTTTACGEVNGKNAMGGYAGFKEFAYRNGVVMFPEYRHLNPWRMIDGDAITDSGNEVIGWRSAAELS